MLMIACWSFGIFTFENTASINQAHQISNINCISALIIAGLFFYFSYSFPQEKRLSIINTLLLFLPAIVFSAILLIDPYFINLNIYTSSDNVKLSTANNWGYIFYALVFSLYWPFAYRNLWKSYKSSSRADIKVQLKMVILGTTIPFLLASYFDLYYAFFNYKYVWIGPLMALLVVLAVLYAVYKHHLFNLKLLFAEIITFTLWVITLIRALLADQTNDIIMESSLLILTVLLGILLIRSVMDESHQKEELADLNLHLSEKVAEQTREIRHAYEIEKKARADLEKLNDSKNQFIMITQHHLRTPVTSINWQLESIKNGVYGNVSRELQVAVNETQTATKRLTHIIDDFLNIAAMKAGSNILNLTDASLYPAVVEVLDELRLDLTRNKIAVSFPSDQKDWPILRVDFSKMKDILLIVIENAIRYNHEGGSIRIKSSTEEGFFKLKIENTGIGITREESEKIGSTLFYRGSDARKLNSIGMGVGLSVAKAIIKGHHGTFGIHSDGKGLGATVTLSLPLPK